MPGEKPALATVLCAGTAAAFAAVTPAALFVGLMSLNGWELLLVYALGVPVALVPAWVLGLPAYYLLRERWALTWTRAALGGFLVGGVPASLFALTFAQGPLPSVEGFLWFGLFGAFGGLGFRAFLLSLE